MPDNTNLLVKLLMGQDPMAGSGAVSNMEMQGLQGMGAAPMPRPDPRTTMRAAHNGTLWPPPPAPYEGWKPKPITPEEQSWLDVGLVPPPQY